MTIVPGTRSAAALIKVGATRSVVIPALRREIGLTDAEAAAAWDTAIADLRTPFEPLAIAVDLRVSA